MVLFLILAAGGMVLLVAALAGVWRWASRDAGVVREESKERFRAEQDWRGLRRAGKL